MKSYFTYNTVIGNLSIIEEDGAVSRIAFEDSVSGILNKETSLIKKTYEQLAEYLVGERQIFDLPLKIEGTDFQLRVWHALQEIPYGETRSYRQIATIAGNAKASRAVGLANNSNPLMLVIPCHRVIGSAGSLNGYAGGVEVKEYLLNMEEVINKKIKD